MKHFFKFALGALVLCAANSAFASTPILSLSATGTGDNVTISVTGDANAGLLLLYTQAPDGSSIKTLGTIGSNGQFSTTVSSASFGLISGTLVKAVTGGVNGLSSSQVAWPDVSAAVAAAGGGFTLSQSALVLNVGSSASVTASGGGSGALYLSNNSNPSITNVSISGTSATISANVAGITTVTICQIGGTTTNCPSVYVIVKPSGTGTLTFSQPNPTVVKGQSLPVTISGGNGSYSIYSNSNASNIQASLSGTILTLTTSATSGASSITVCTSDNAMCGVVVATAGDQSSVSVTFSTNSPSTSVGLNTTVNIYGPTGVTFYVSSNSNPSVVQANLSGTILTLAGIAAGTSNVTICVSTGNCGTVNATVQYAPTATKLALSQNTLSMTTGQNANVTISGGTMPYSIAEGASAITSQSISGNILTVTGNSAGVSSLAICSAGKSCVSLDVTVNGTGTGTSFSMSPTALSLNTTQAGTGKLSGASSYAISGNTNPQVATVVLSGSTVTVTGISAGVTNAVVCASGGACGTLLVNVSTAVTPVASTPVTPSPAPVTVPSYTFTKYLTPGSSGTEVKELQKVLVAQGLLKATPNGYFGNQTLAAVKKFQAAHKLSQLGVVGPGTRTALNAVTPAVPASTSSATTTITQTQQDQLHALQAQLAALLLQQSQAKGQ